MYKRVIVLCVVLSFLVPQYSEARHRYRSIDRDKLDEDVVETFAIPVLFERIELSENFGDPRDGGTRLHEGLDIFARKGTPIVSPTEAIVISTGKGDSAGNYVYTANPGGETFRYMHLDSIADIDPGDELDIGDLIGTVGDTGNAPDGVYHLHLEVRDEDNEATDPFPRLTKVFTNQERMSFVDNILDTVDEDKDDYAAFLVTTFTDDFKAGLRAGYRLPEEIVEALEDIGIVSTVRAEEQLAETLAQIPQALVIELSPGDNSLLVSLLQVYLIYTTEGPAREALKSAGPTGYYGTITANAVSAYQTTHGLTATGMYDADTRSNMTKQDVRLNLE